MTFCCAASVASDSARSDDALRQRFLEQAPRAWAELDELLAQHTHIIVHDTFGWVGEDAAEVKRRTSDWKESGHNVLEQLGQFVQDGDGLGAQAQSALEVICVNAKYAFRLSRDSASARWVLTLLTQDLEYLRRWLENSSGRPGRSGWMIDGTLVRDLLSEPGFVVEEVTLLPYGGHDCVQVHFRFIPEQAKLQSRIRGGFAVFDPRRRWVIAKSTVRLAHQEGEVVANSTFDYVDTPAGTPVLRREIVETVGYRPETHRVVFDYETSMDANVSDNDFTLSAFGLPEPGLPDDHPRGRFAWVLLLAAVPFLLLANWLRRYARKSRAT